MYSHHSTLSYTYLVNDSFSLSVISACQIRLHFSDMHFLDRFFPSLIDTPNHDHRCHRRHDFFHMPDFFLRFCDQVPPAQCLFSVSDSLCKAPGPAVLQAAHRRPLLRVARCRSARPAAHTDWSMTHTCYTHMYPAQYIPHA